MGLLSWLLPCTKYKLQRHQTKSHSNSNNFLHSELSSLSSQPSLPSVPSLTPHHHQSSAVNHHCLAILRGHSTYVNSLALDGNFLYSCSSDSEIRCWTKYPSENNNSKASFNIVANSNGAVKSLVVKGDKLYSAHQDCKIRVWKIDSNQNYNCIATLPTMNDRFLRFFSPKNHVQVRRHKKKTWVHHVDTVSALAISKDGCLLYSTSWDRTFKIWRTMDFKCLESITNAHDDAINTLVQSNDGFIYTGSADKKIKVWKRQEVEKKKKKKHKHLLVTTLEKHKSTVNALALSKDGSLLYSGACDRSILVWEKGIKICGEMDLAGAIRGHKKAILCLAVVSDLVCSGSADNTVRIWRRSEKRNYYCLAVLEGHKRAVKCLSIADNTDDENGSDNSDSGSSSNYLVYSGSLDCDIRIWRIGIP